MNPPVFRHAVTGAAAALLAAFGAGHAAAVSFDCAKAQNPDEKTICGDTHLSDLDVLATRPFTDALKKAEPAERPKIRAVVYLVTNTRTNATWWLSGSEHMCGGA